MSSFRKQQIESTLKRAIAKVLTQQLADPRVVGMISVTSVDVSPDLKQALVYVTVMPQKFEKKTLAGLKHAVGHIYGLVCKAVALKSVPKLEFRVDASIKKEAAIFAAINRGMKHEKPLPPAGEPGEEDPTKVSSEEASAEEDQAS